MNKNKHKFNDQVLLKRKAKNESTECINKNQIVFKFVNPFSSLK